MKHIKPTNNPHGWPRNKVDSILCRKKDLVLRISDWMKDKEEPAYDVEVYIGGVYDWNESKTFTLSSGLTKKQAKQKAIEFSQRQIERLL